MRVRLAVPDMHVGPDVLDPMLEAVTRTDQHQILSGMVPLADEAIAHGVKWRPEPPGDEHFDPASTVMVRGHGDCDDLAPWKAASLRVTGEDPGAYARVIPTGDKRFHAIVQRSDGSIDDPSADAGMYEYHPPVQPVLSGALFRPQIAWRKVKVGFVSRCDLPMGRAFSVSGHGYGESLGQAMSEAVTGAVCVGQASGAVDAQHLMRLQACDALLRGADPHELAELLHGLGHHNARAVVGSLFGSLAHLAKSALPIASSFVPIPGASLAADMIAHAIPGGGGGHGSPAAAAAAAPGAMPGMMPGAPPPPQHERIHPAVVVPPYVVRW